MMEWFFIKKTDEIFLEKLKAIHNDEVKRK